MNRISTIVLIFFAFLMIAGNNSCENRFYSSTDIISLHYDHAPDKDDGHSAAADRTMLESLYGTDWIEEHVVAVSGTYGENESEFNSDSNKVMNAAWGDCGGWLSAHSDPDGTLEELTLRWVNAIEDGGDVWVKEGGQSDVTAKVVKQVKKALPETDITEHIHVVQHSDWNEEYTSDSALKYTKNNTDYIRISDANEYLQSSKNIKSFVNSALNDSNFSDVWETAFDYYDPLEEKLDFSDTGELMHILDLGEIDIDEFKERYFE